MFKFLTTAALIVLLAAPALAAEKEGYVGIQLKMDETSGKITVQAVVDDGPAAKAGFKLGDILVKVGDKDADNLQNVVNAIRAGKPGDKFKFKILRDEKEMTIEVTLGERPRDMNG